uniref:GCM domain-containing protein n=1 Tax=Lutzomyia longipalpis TaxID=7200 RepID=A0A1B0GKX5_LUTLO
MVIFKERMTKDWDINDTNVPIISDSDFDDFCEWADGHVRLVYPVGNEDAKKHTSGWAMRNTNNHNLLSLRQTKKSPKLHNTDIMRPPPLIPDSNIGDSSTCLCPTPNCSCRLMSNNLSQTSQYPFAQSSSQFGYAESFGLATLSHQQTQQQQLNYWNHSQNQFSGAQFTESGKFYSTYTSDCSMEISSHNQMSGDTTNQQDLYQFSPLSGDLFQPEEIFQLDQPLKPPGGVNNSISPPTFLDLGSGTIQQQHRGLFPDEENTNNSSSSRNNESSPHQYELRVFGQSHFNNNNHQMHTEYFCDPSSSNDPQQFIQYDADMRFAKSENYASISGGYDASNGTTTGDGYRIKKRYVDEMEKMNIYAQPPITPSLEKNLEESSSTYYHVSPSQYPYAAFQASEYDATNSNNNHMALS